jgi:hypothetical protein
MTETPSGHFQHRPVPLLHRTQPHQHTRLPPAKRPACRKPGNQDGVSRTCPNYCHPATGTASANCRLGTEPRCPASTGLAHNRQVCRTGHSFHGSGSRSRLTKEMRLSPDHSRRLLAARSVPRIAVTAGILASGYDGGPAGGPSAGGFHRPRGLPWVAGTGPCWSAGVGQRADTLPGPRDRLGPRPVRGDLPAAAAPAAHEAGGGVQDAVAQRLGLGLGQVAV